MSTRPGEQYEKPDGTTDMSNLTAQLASFIHDVQVPPAACGKAKKAFLDTVGVMLSGADSEVASPLTKYLQDHHHGSGSPILGTSLNAPAEIAAMINGTFGHALDFDDGVVSAPVHPSSVVVAALLADARTISGKSLLSAYVVGVEVAVKLAVAIGIEHYHHGWHGTGTLGIFGAVAALAHARRLDPALTQNAFGLAASMTSGVQCNFGTMTKPLHAGWAARNAVVAFELSCAGFSAAPDALEAKNGFFAVYGNVASDPRRVLRELGNPFTVVDPGLSLKRYACCYASHRPIEGLLALRKESGLSQENVESVRCVLAPGSMRALIYPRPRTGLEGKFSLEYALAAGVIDGNYSLWSFSDEAVTRPAAQALLPRITAVEDPRCAAGDPHASTRGPSRRGFIEVHVKTRDGKEAMRRVDKLPGSPDQELSLEEVRAKFLDCAKAANLNIDRAQMAFDLLARVEDCTNLPDVLKLLQQQ